MIRVRTDLKDIDRQIERFRERLVEATADKVEGIVVRIHDGLYDEWPVYSGDSLASWTVSVNAPEYEYRQLKLAPPPTGTAAANTSFSDDKNRDAAWLVTQATREAVDFSDPFRTFYIANGAPHAAAIEYGGQLQNVRARTAAGGHLERVVAQALFED